MVIVGAGIVGSACARECARAGLRTAIVEGVGAAPGSATAAAMGHVVLMDDFPAQFALTRYSRSLWREDRERMQAEGVDCRAPGTVWVAANEVEFAHVAAQQKVYEQAGVEAELLDAAALARCEPNLRVGMAGALWVRGDLICDPSAAARFYLLEAQKLGVELVHARAVAAAQGVVTLANGTRLTAAQIVLATGFECELMPTLPLRRRKGHLVVTEPSPGFVRHQVVELGYLTSAHKVEKDSVAFNVQPRPNGAVLIGASRQYGNHDPAVDQHIVDQLLTRAYSFMPGLRGVETAHIRTGFRAATPDKLPIVGPATGLAEDASIWVCAGFEGLGITCAPGAARLLVDGLLGREAAIDPAPYLASRFAKENA